MIVLLLVVVAFVVLVAWATWSLDDEGRSRRENRRRREAQAARSEAAYRRSKARYERWKQQQGQGL